MRNTNLPLRGHFSSVFWSISALLIIYPPIFTAIVIKLNDLSTPEGASVFHFQVTDESSLWSYHLDEITTSESIRKAFKVDSETGKLTVARTLECDDILTLNGSFFFLRTVSDSNPGDSSANQASFFRITIRTSVAISFEGNKCIGKKVNNSLGYLNAVRSVSDVRAEDQDSIVNIISKRFCLSRGSHFGSVFDLLPQCLGSNSEAVVDQRNPRDVLAIDPTTGILWMKEDTCLTHPVQMFVEIHHTGNTSGHSSPGIYPLQLILQADKKDNQDIEEVLAVSYAELHKNRGKRSRKLNTIPTFPHPKYVVDVLEEQRPGLPVATITANDPDLGEAGTLTYSLVAVKDGRSQEFFAIDSTNGRITTTRALDRETMPAHYFQVVARDSGKPVQSAAALLTVLVTDVNDHSPTFEKPFYSAEISEAVGIGTTVLNIRAKDADADSNADIRYSLGHSSDDSSAFHMDPVLGSISTVGLLDRETKDRYLLEVVATDRALVTDRRTSTTQVEIALVDENDNKPVFEKDVYTVHIPEDIDHTSSPVVVEIKATDADSDANGVVRYSIIGGNSKNTFAIDAISGHVTLAQPLDFELTSEYHVNVRAQDGGSPPKSNSTTVVVKVVDVNDNSPRFYTSGYQESVPENVPVGQTVLKVQAYDADSGPNGAIVYAIREPVVPDMPLVIDEKSGAIVTVAGLDRERESRYSFRVEARDSGADARTATAAVNVIVRDVNDNAPVFHPKIYQELVSEETELGFPVVTVTARDADEDENGRISYSIDSGNIRGTFGIISQMGSGMIVLKRSLNFKEQNRYVLTVTASDAVHQDTATVYINVTDANLHRPRFHGTPYVTRIDEDTPVGSGIFKVIAVDDDSGENARLTYSMETNDVFQIVGRTGDVILKSPLDREKVPGYTLTVQVSDNGRPSKSDTTDLEVMVVDVNDNAPVFARGSYSGRVSEDELVGTSVLSVSAADDDAGLNGAVRYTFDGGSSGGGDFTIDPTTGVIRIARELDRERVARYSLTAVAVDRGRIERSSSIVVDVEIEDVNDNSPQFETTNIVLYIKENSPIGSTVGEIQAVDVDEGVNSIVEYSIIGGADLDSFALIAQHHGSAVLTTLTELDYESDRKVFTVVVRARSAHLFSDATVKIVIVDVNDNSPYMKDFTILFNNYKDTFPAEAIGTLPAFDPDVSDRLKFRFVSGNDARLLHLNEDTGEVRLDARLNSDVSVNATFVVSVTDGINEVRATCRLFVRFVTEQMLNNSITLRINGLHQSAFLSPLYHLFVGAVASIVPALEDNVFVLNIREDNEVREKVLNVSFSVRQRTEYGRDVFYSSRFLKERFYFQRALMAKLSTLEVLPFDDNLCLREPCLNFEECVSTLRFGNASSVISSDTMLFRPLQPHSSFECRCPVGFTGMNSEYLCDTEVNLCYSNPCGHNGKCIQRESGFTCSCMQGFTGDRCEIDLQSKTYTQCPENVCRHPSRCAPLIRGGIRCEICSSGEEGGGGETVCMDCQTLEHRTKFCELRTRSFPNGSFILFPSLKQRHRFQIHLSFATREKNALLLYNGRYNNKHDFIALGITNSQVVFSFSLGATVSHVTAYRKKGVSDGSWHQITLDYYNRTATLTVGSDCDTQLSLLYGSVLPDYRCADTVTQKLEERCSDVTESCHRFLDLTGPLQLGSLPSLPTEYQVHSTSFTGCMRDLRIDGRLMDMNAHAWNSDTAEGCPHKTEFCRSTPCRNGGTCTNGWGMYLCECPTGWTGKDCSQESELPVYHLTGLGHLLFTQANHGLANIRLPWFNGLSFRTRQQTPAVLLSIEIGTTATKDQFSEIVIQMVNGTIFYSHSMQTVAFEEFPANDGQWHYLETRWLPGELIITLDYGHFQRSSRMGDWIVGQTVGQVVVGRRLAEGIGDGGFVGCVKAVRVGSSPGVLLSQPEVYNAEIGCELKKSCSVSDVCRRDRSTCIDLWGSHECRCFPGRIGSDCVKICDGYNPCRNGATCIESPWSPKKYSCQCDLYHDGEYCERSINTTCPSTWWGTPVCGPCNCPKEKGFDSRCNKTTGECYCKENHYHQGDLCIPCNCYEFGSFGRSCDRSTGQCVCRKGVTGRQCNSCHSKFAEVTLRGCEVVYHVCPKSFSGRIWWKRTNFFEVAYEECPEGSAGVASRFCNETEGWKVPDLSNCTSVSFLELGQQLKLIERQHLKMNTFLVKGLLSKLETATRLTAVMRSTDIIITYRLIIHILNYESRQTGLNLGHTQDRNFIQYIANCLSRILDPMYLDEWMRLNQDSNASVLLLKSLEMYSMTLAKNMLVTFTQPMDAVHDNIVIGLDFLASNNLSHVVVPKYNNKVQSHAMFDKETKTLLPAGIFTGMNEFRNRSASLGRYVPTISYVLFRTFGDFLPRRYDDSVRQIGSVSVVINSPLFMMNIFDGEKLVGEERFSEPIRIQFLPRIHSNRSNAQCVHWLQTQDSPGVWSADGCQLSPHRFSDLNLIECHCNHLTTFGVLMEARSAQASLSSLYRPELSLWIGVGIAIVCFIITIVIFFILLRFGTNLISIHLNLAMVLLLVDATFVFGIDRTEPKIVCRLIAILLQYFLTSSFAWIFVESLHLYRMITSIRDVNRGPMHFYYAVGYVVPGIIIGLSVGLSAGSYGNQFFCWLKLHDIIFLTFAGPVAFLILISAILFVISLGSTCHNLPKHSENETNSMKYEVGAGSILLILMTLGLFFGVLSLNEAVPAFRYLFSSFICLQGIFVLAINVVLNKEVKSQLNYICYAKKDSRPRRLPAYMASHSSTKAPIYGAVNKNPVSLGSNDVTRVACPETVKNNPEVISSQVESYVPFANGQSGITGNQKKESIPMTNISRVKTNDRVGDYSDSEEEEESSDVQNPEGVELASSHSSDEDCESCGQDHQAAV